MWFSKSGLFIPAPETYNTGLFGSPAQVDDISCIVCRPLGTGVAWPGFSKLGRGGCFFGIAGFSGQPKVIIQFDSQSHGTEYYDFNYGSSNITTKYILYTLLLFDKLATHSIVNFRCGVLVRLKLLSQRLVKRFYHDEGSFDNYK